MSEFYMEAISNPAPFFGDTSYRWQSAKTPLEACDEFIENYTHPAGLYSLHIYKDANAKSRDAEPLVIWYSINAMKGNKIKGAIQ